MTSSPSSPRSGRMLYLAALKPTLEASLCLQDFHSQNIERHNKPEIEVQSSSELLLNPVTVCRSPDEKVTVEASINSTRINLFYLHSDPLKRILRKKFLKFMTRRAEQFIIVRRKPVAGFDVSFLITNFHLDHLHKHKIVDFILYFIEDLDKEKQHNPLLDWFWTAIYHCQESPQESRLSSPPT
ncbi:hypothetical protein GE061_004228 [Apolygus lucorum]|uniref:Uncharacterized protein n=1 Tax=Apolygus lucorum TaxID=248454 RepID=A0A8S9WYR9_APOLU|nr:hypothetical protein GE061_004228 [Apolygus lucorum]